MSRFSIKSTVFWAYLDKENDLSGKFQVDLSQLSDAAVDKLTEEGLSVMNKSDERGSYVTSKSKYPIFAYDKDGNRITDPIGNGSTATVLVEPYPWKFKGKEGVSLSIVKLRIDDLEIYEAVPEDFSEEMEEAL